VRIDVHARMGRFPLTGCRWNSSYSPQVRRPDGCALAGNREGEESPGSTETRCRITSGGGDPRESATENRPPARFAHWVNWAGKGETVG
jgi:hypothetical protein